jgi:anti-sigma factor RsiW
MSTGTRPILEADLHAFADGFATAERRAEIVAYLEADPEAARRMNDWCTQNEAIRRALGKAIPHPLPELMPAAEPCRLKRAKPEVKTLAFDPAHTAEGSPRVRRALGTRWRSPPSVVAGALLLGVAGGWLAASGAWGTLRSSTLPRVEEPAPALDAASAYAEDAIETYNTFVAGPQFPTELTARDKARLAPWLSRHLGETVALPDPAPLGYAIVASRIVATHAGTAAMLLLANPAGDRLALMVARPHPSIAPGTHYREGTGTGAVVWAVDGHFLALAGVAGRARLSMLAGRMGGMANRE